MIEPEGQQRNPLEKEILAVSLRVVNVFNRFWYTVLLVA